MNYLPLAFQDMKNTFPTEDFSFKSLVVLFLQMWSVICLIILFSSALTQLICFHLLIFPSNPTLPNIRSLIKKQRNRNLKEILSPSLYTERKNDKKLILLKTVVNMIFVKNFWLVIVALFARLRIRNILKTILIVIVCFISY